MCLPEQKNPVSFGFKCAVVLVQFKKKLKKLRVKSAARKKKFLYSFILSLGRRPTGNFKRGTCPAGASAKFSSTARSSATVTQGTVIVGRKTEPAGRAVFASVSQEPSARTRFGHPPSPWRSRLLSSYKKNRALCSLYYRPRRRGVVKALSSTEISRT